MANKIAPVKFDRVVIYDEQGAGRCWVGKVMLEDRFKKLGIDVPVLAVGLTPPKTGIKTMDHGVADMLSSKGYIINPEQSFITLMEKKLLTPNTLVLGLTNEPPPDYLPETVLEWFVENKLDPFPGIQRPANFRDNLDLLATQVYYDCWILEQLITKNPEKIGERREGKKLLLPKELPDPPEGVELGERSRFYAVEAWKEGDSNESRRWRNR